MRLAPSQKSAAFVTEIDGGSPCALFYLIRDPAGLQIGVQNLAKFPVFESDASRVAIVGELKALGLNFRTEPADPAQSWPTIPLGSLFSEDAWNRVMPFLLTIINKAKLGDRATA